MIVVHHLNNSRSQRVLWLLEELGVPYEVKRYERNAQTMLAPPELKAIHPLGKSPVIEDDGVIYAETGAIIEHLLAAHPGNALTPPSGSAAARRVTYWLHYAEGSAMTPLLLKLVFGALPARSPGLVRPLVKAISGKTQSSFIDPQIATHKAYWEAELTKAPWFAGEAFSAADIMMSFPVEAASSRSPFGDDMPRLKAWLATIHARPAYQRALERGGPYAYA
jgi:glutathione S-transferase